MTRKEFVEAMPFAIDHKGREPGKLEIVVDEDFDKGACYRHSDNTASCCSYGTTWDVVYKKMIGYLNFYGYLTSLN